jgi:hypothetical protein
MVRAHMFCAIHIHRRPAGQGRKEKICFNYFWQVFAPQQIHIRFTNIIAHLLYLSIFMPAYFLPFFL